MTRSTIPLGAVNDVSVEKIGDLNKDFATLPLQWWVNFYAKSPAILMESWTVYLRPGEIDDPAKDTIKSESGHGTFLEFQDEPMAKRVAGAFKHAAELCRGKEPF